MRRGLLGIIDNLLDRGIAIGVAALEEGALTQAIRERNIDVGLAPSVARPAVATNPLLRVLAYGRRWTGSARLIFWLAEQIQRIGASDVLVRSPPETLLAGLAGRRAGASTFWLMPNSVSSKYPLDLNKWIYEVIFRIGRVTPIANSRYTATTLLPSAGSRYVSHLGVPPQDFRLKDALAGREVRQSFGISPGTPVLGIFARLIPNKGQSVLIRAFAQMRNEEAHLLICGGPVDSEYFGSLRELTIKLGVSSRVHLTGPIEDVQRFYDACDIVVNSRLDPEPFGFSVIEAMMMGIPVLAHRAGGPGETIIDGKTGWLVDEPTCESFHDGLERMMADRGRWQGMGRFARVHAEENFSNSAMVDRLLNIMRDQGDRLENPNPIPEIS